MSTAAKTTKQEDDAAAISAEITQLRKDLSSLVDTVGAIGKSRASSASQAVADKAAKGAAAGETALADLSGELRKLEGELVDATRRSPFKALGFAIFAGFVAGFIFRR